MKLDKKVLKDIALSRFFDQTFESVFDHWTAALEVYLKQEGYIIVKAPNGDQPGGMVESPKEQK